MEVRTSSKSDDWPTPQWLVDQLAAEFAPGGFDLDPAATAETAKAAAIYTADDDGLSRPWFGRCFLNPPYGRTIGQWIRKAITEVDGGHADLVVCLVPARTDTHWWREAMAARPLVRFWPGRIRFGVDVPGYSRRDVSDLHNAPFTSAVLVFGKLTGRHGTEAKRCAAPGCGQWFWPAYASRKTCSERCRKALYRTRQLSQIERRKRDKSRARKRAA
jgi:phage N-6-adenine-methyltransferase